MYGQGGVPEGARESPLALFELNADESVIVRYVTFSPLNGFEETVMKCHQHSSHGVVRTP